MNAYCLLLSSYRVETLVSAQAHPAADPRVTWRPAEWGTVTEHLACFMPLLSPSLL